MKISSQGGLAFNNDNRIEPKNDDTMMKSRLLFLTLMLCIGFCLVAQQSEICPAKNKVRNADMLKKAAPKQREGTIEEFDQVIEKKKPLNLTCRARLTT